MAIGVKLRSGFKALGKDLLLVFLKTYTAKSLVFVLILAVLSLIIRSHDWTSRKVRLFEEGFNHYLWYYKAEVNNSPPIDAVILDLYTSETYNASPDLYQSRYQIFRLADNLKLSCILGAEIVLFDFFLNSESWMGKYLESDEGAEDAAALVDALSCYKKVFMPVRKIENETIYSPTIKPLLILGAKLNYVTTLTSESKLYQPFHTFQTPNGSINLPYTAFALALQYSPVHLDIVNHYPDGTLPLQFSYHPLGFDRASRKEMKNLTKAYDSVKTDDHEIQKIVLQPVFESDRYWSRFKTFPKTVLVGFTHNVDDQHDWPYTLFGSISLQINRDESRRSVLAFEGEDISPKRETSGKESDIPFTPGLYAILSTANALVNGDIPLYPCYRWPLLSLLLYCTLGWLSIEWGRLLVSSSGRRLFFMSVLVVYVFLVGLAFWNSVYLPLIVPCSAILCCYLGSSYLYNRQLAKRLATNYRYDFEESQQELVHVPWEERKPLLIVQAEQALAIKADSTSVLLARIDLVIFWIQLLGLFQWADYFWYQKKLSPLSIGDWEKSLGKPSLGRYKYALARFGKNFKSELDAQRSFFPQIYFSLVGTSKKRLQPFEKALDDAVGMRNKWRHHTSSSKSDQDQEAAIASISSLLEQIEEHVTFLKTISLIKPIAIQSISGDEYTWKCMFYNGPACYLGEISTRQQLTVELLYLYNHMRSTDIHGSLLRLDPWIVAGNCILHHREELFQFVGYKKGKCLYAGLTEDCKPAFERLMPEDAIFRSAK
ncbi:hypothetical protein KJ966_20770 [bacterium]|nr:hypothetical protein [bacterium]